MAITLAVGATSIDLHPDLFWNDENQWHPVEQTAQRTITGAMVVSSSTKIAGRPITLQPEDDSSGWMPQTVVTQLRNWAAVPGQVLQLTLRGTTRDVIFRHHDGAAIEALPVIHYSDVQSDDWYRCTIRLMEV